VRAAKEASLANIFESGLSRALCLRCFLSSDEAEGLFGGMKREQAVGIDGFGADG
jgi:hypothetical protein